MFEFDGILLKPGLLQRGFHVAGVLAPLTIIGRSRVNRIELNGSYDWKTAVPVKALEGQPNILIRKFGNSLWV